MNSIQAMKDPAAGIAAQLLPHLHLVSKYRYPITSNPSLETILGYLLEAPKIMRDIQPVQWQFLEAPQDGTLMLVWQPLEYLGTNFASDGYIWADAEHIFKSDVRGYTLEMFLQRSGYRAQGETMAIHSRRRYRLIPGNPNLGLPNADTSLWIIHYSKASPRDSIPAASIPIMPHVHNQIQQRRMIQAQGQLTRKEFMLHDRANWPMINAPQGVVRPGTAGQMAPGQAHRRGPSLNVTEATLEEEEDVSRGDMLDFMTPRDISRMRYEQHHEWMEEILESPYNILQIVPSDLGLGRKGELEELTKDFFDAPTSAVQEPPINEAASRGGRMAVGKVEEFADRATQKLADMQAELEKMKQKHTRRMEKLRRTTVLNAAEKKLRSASSARESRSASGALHEGSSDRKASEFGDETTREVEDFLGKKLDRTTNVACVSRGGLEDRYSTASLNNGSALGAPTPPIKVSSDTAQTHGTSEQQIASQSSGADSEKQTPSSAQNEPLVQSGTSAATPRVPEPGTGTETEQHEEHEMQEDEADEETAPQQEDELPLLEDMGMDVDMAGLDHESAEEGGNEWVMVDDQNTLLDPGNDKSEVTSQQEVSQAIPDTNTLQPVSNEEGKPETVDQTAVVPQQEQDLNVEPADFDMGGEFDDVDVDTAGDALASYGADDDEELNLDNMDDSAFGDAFHPEDNDID